MQRCRLTAPVRGYGFHLLPRMMCSHDFYQAVIFAGRFLQLKSAFRRKSSAVSPCKPVFFKTNPACLCLRRQVSQSPGSRPLGLFPSTGTESPREIAPPPGQAGIIRVRLMISPDFDASRSLGHQAAWMGPRTRPSLPVRLVAIADARSAANSAQACALHRSMIIWRFSAVVCRAIGSPVAGYSA